MSKEQQMIEYMVQDLVEMHTETQGVEYDTYITHRSTKNL